MEDSLRKRRAEAILYGRKIVVVCWLSVDVEWCSGECGGCYWLSACGGSMLGGAWVLLLNFNEPRTDLYREDKNLSKDCCIVTLKS